MHLVKSSRSSDAGRRLTLAIILSAFFLVGGASADLLTVDYDFPAPDLQTLDGRTQVTMDGCMSGGEPGQPILPRFGARILIPAGETISSVELIAGERVLIDGSWSVAPGQKQYPLSLDVYDGPDAPDAAIYDSDEPFPGILYNGLDSGFYRGHRIATLVIHPVEYLPASGQLSYITGCELRVRTEASAASMDQSRRMIRHDEATLNRIEKMVDNVDVLASYAGIQREGASRTLDPADAYKYVIIASGAYGPYLDDFVQFQTRRGLKAGIFDKDWILANYTGGDEQTVIRNFIIDAYAAWETDYVLLVGDSGPADGIPHRGMYADAYGTVETNLPSDLYYACLDGNWNADGDGYWGETGDSPDMYHELGVGRAAVSSPTELQNWIVKQMRYQTDPIVGECDEALMVGELLWDDPTWGGTYKDEVKNGSSNHGYTTAGFPASMNVGTLYDRDMNPDWSASQLINLMNSGLNIINHLGHCDYTYMMKFYNTDVGDFTNDGLNHSYNFIYSQGCMCGGFDQSSISENLNNDEHGPVALVTNSRYGWGEHASTNGSSQYFDREFFDAMFAESIFPLADVNNDSKEDVLWNIAYGANRWCYYELNLFGDPAMQLWTGEPQALMADLPGVVFIGEPTMEITVHDGGIPIQGARVCIFTDDYAVYDAATTNAFGVATLNPDAAAPATLHVKIVAHDYLEYGADVEILPPSGPYLVFGEAQVLDGAGDDDGILDEGETVGLDVILENVGVDPTSNVTATLSTEDPYVTLLGAEADYPDIPAGGTGACIVPFQVQIAGDVPDGHIVAFSIHSSASEGDWDSNFYLAAQAPQLELRGYDVIDVPYGNGSSTADAGETFTLRVDVGNVGQSDAEDLSAELSFLGFNVVIHDAFADCAIIPQDGQATVQSFEVEILATCPEPSTLEFQMLLSNASGFSAQMDVPLSVGGWFDDFESDRGWIVGAAGDDASSGIWTRVDPIGTDYGGSPVQPEDDHTAAPGVACFVTGQGSAGGSAGENDVDSGQTTLTTPIFQLQGATSADLSYWRWYTNDLGNNPGEDYWLVQVTNDGVSWVDLENTNVSNNAWQQMSFDLADFISFTDQVQIRFVASDEGSGSLVEAAVDDVLLDTFIPIATAVDELVPARLELGRNFPNPFNPNTKIRFALPGEGRVDLAVYDIQGRRVATLVGGEMQAGYHEVDWLGVDEGGHPVASGIYFSRLSFGKEVRTAKMMMLK